jgi:hypothetical protein
MSIFVMSFLPGDLRPPSIAALESPLNVCESQRARTWFYTSISEQRLLQAMQKNSSWHTLGGQVKTQEHAGSKFGISFSFLLRPKSRRPLLTCNERLSPLLINQIFINRVTSTDFFPFLSSKKIQDKSLTIPAMLSVSRTYIVQQCCF